MVLLAQLVRQHFLFEKIDKIAVANALYKFKLTLTVTAG